MGLKEITGLPAKPDQGYLKFLHDRSAIVGALEWTDISYHPEAGWLKIWYDEDLTAEQETEIESLVTTSQTAVKFKVETGSEYFEHSVGNTKWNRYRTRVKFRDGFSTPPTVEIFNAEFDGVADMQVVSVGTRGFNFLIESNQPPAKVGLNSMQFDWRAWSA
jgi:hypothetical protein